MTAVSAKRLRPDAGLPHTRPTPPDTAAETTHRLTHPAPGTTNGQATRACGQTPLGAR